MAVTIGGPTPWQQEVTKTGAYTVLVGDSGTLFNTLGNVGSLTFTLPAIAGAAGCVWWFRNDADQVMIITAPANKFYLDGSLTGTSATFSTSSHKIGCYCKVYLNAAGTFYCLENYGAPAGVLTVS